MNGKLESNAETDFLNWKKTEKDYEAYKIVKKYFESLEKNKHHTQEEYFGEENDSDSRSASRNI